MDKETRMGAIRALQEVLIEEMEHYNRIVGAVAGLTSLDPLQEGRDGLLDQLSDLRIALDSLRDWEVTGERGY